MKSMKGGSASGTSRTEKDMPMPFILGGILLIILIIWLAPAIPVSPLGALLIVIFGFFFSTVSARMVGMIGSSNNPVSGMTIATLLIATMILKATGNVGIEGMIGSMAIASVICICAAIAADTSQDLKTGYLLGATGQAADRRADRRCCRRSGHRRCAVPAGQRMGLRWC